MDKPIKLELTEEQADLIKEAIDVYEYATANVISFDEHMYRRNNIINPIYNQLPDELF